MSKETLKPILPFDMNSSTKQFIMLFIGLMTFAKLYVQVNDVNLRWFLIKMIKLWARSKGKGKSHSQLVVGAVNGRVPLVSMGTACEGWCPSPLPSSPKPSPALKRVGYPFAAGCTKRIFRSPDQRWFQSGDLHC